MEKEYLAVLIAVLGTTISQYLLFWQAGEEVEQMQSEPRYVLYDASCEQA